MYSASDFEKFRFLFKTAGEPKGISLNSFCASHGVPYTQFNTWFRKPQRSVVSLEVDGLPTEGSSTDSFENEERIPVPSRNVKSGNIQVTIQTRDGLHIRKSNLDYQGLRHLVERLEGLC